MKIRYLSLRQAVSVVRNTVAEGELESTLELRLLDESINDDVVEVVRCKDCKHRPIDTQEEGNGFDYEFPEEYSCPGYCDDGYYSERFKDDFYCAWGERTDE